MKTEAYLGIDTSCYTTSVALMDTDGSLLSETRRPLLVKEGSRGLKQSEMVFQHTRNLPGLVTSLCKDLAVEIKAVCVSGRPRPADNSYMPAFLPGLGLAESLIAFLNVSLYKISHQENHMEAGLWSAGGPLAPKFIMLHASGGTTDLLLAEEDSSGSYKLNHIGGSVDLHAGQFVDRAGVALGLPFPAGPHLEALAATAREKISLPVCVNGLNISFSGPETAARRLIESNSDRPAIALGVQCALAKAFSEALLNAAKTYCVFDVLLVGGVGANEYISDFLKSALCRRGIKLWQPVAKYSGDNAVGCAYHALRMEAKNAKQNLHGL